MVVGLKELGERAYRCPEEVIAHLEVEVLEAEKAKDLLRKIGGERKVYAQIGGIIVEVSAEEAIDMLDLRIASLKKQIRLIRETSGRER